MNKKIHLMHQTHPEVWFLLEEGTDYIGAMHGGLVSWAGSEDVAQADSIADLLHILRETGDPKWFAVLDFIDSAHNTRFSMYPNHYDLHVLCGFVPEVCDVRIEDHCYLADGQVRYVSELWIQTSEERLLKVRGFSEKARADAEAFIEQTGLKYEEVAS